MDDLRETIARALFVHQYPGSTAWDAPGEFGRATWWKRADTVIEALGLTEERRENGRNLHDGPDAEHWTEHRYVTTWKRVP